MKRMIDGIINYKVSKGLASALGDDATTAEINFYFPGGYYPLGISSKPFSVLPGTVDYFAEAESVRAFTSDYDQPWSSVAVNGISIGNDGESTVTYLFTFADKTTREEFVERMFGKNPKYGEGQEFATEISMILIRTDAASEF